ncbi:thioredoxin-dependent thiol peroxidase [soil metagenome]
MTRTDSDMTSPWISKQAPDFSLEDQKNHLRHLGDYAGRWLVIYFYPKDSTPGCEAESCGFRDRSADLEKVNASVVGISILDTASKSKFASELKLSFPLLADEDHAVAEAYGVWKEKSMYGKTFMGVSRETFVLAPDGRIAAHWPKAKGTGEHSSEVLEKIIQLQSQG